MNTAIELKGVQYNIQNKTLLHVPSLAIRGGEVTGIIGPNGAGKSTILKVMALLQKPTSGEIYIHGNKLWPGNISVTEKRDLAVVFQQPLMLDTTVYKNVAVGLKYRKVPREQMRERVDQWLDKFGISHLAKRRAKLLSGGEAQRVALARAMVTEPKVLFLDEPFSALDLPTKRKILHDFKQILHDSRTTTIFISHDFQEVNFLCEDVFVLYAGTIVDQMKANEWKQTKWNNEVSTFLREWTTPL